MASSHLERSLHDIFDLWVHWKRGQVCNLKAPPSLQQEGGMLLQTQRLVCSFVFALLSLASGCIGRWVRLASESLSIADLVRHGSIWVHMGPYFLIRIVGRHET